MSRQDPAASSDARGLDLNQGAEADLWAATRTAPGSRDGTRTLFLLGHAWKANCPIIIQAGSDLNAVSRGVSYDVCGPFDAEMNS